MRHQMLPRTDSLDLSKKLKQFYQSQTQLIEDFESTSLLVTGERDLDDEDEAERHKTRVAIATKMSLGANIILLIIKLVLPPFCLSPFGVDFTVPGSVCHLGFSCRARFCL